MANNLRPAAKTGSGCLILFSLPFAAVGVVMGVWFASTLVAYFGARNWVETPARVIRADLKITRDGKSTSCLVTAEYTYDFGGRQYHGSRVGLSGGADNIGSFQQDAFRELSQYQKSGKPFRCYVNPARPDEALLYREFRWETAAFQMLFALVFSVIGFGLLIGALVAYRQERARAELVAAHPNSPWMWKADWAAGRIVSSTKPVMWAALAFAVFWNLFSAPLWCVLPGEIVHKRAFWDLVAMLFPVLGLVLVACAAYAILRWLKYGESVFQMAVVPGQIGGQLAGVVRTSAKIRPEDGFHLALRCVRRISTGSGKGRRTTDKVVWEGRQTVMHELLDDQTAVSAIPVVFQIPADCQPSDDADPDDQIVWRLTASAKVPGIDYSAAFEVPMFRTGEGPSSPPLASEPVPG
jgi:hypothetical protein